VELGFKYIRMEKITRHLQHSLCNKTLTADQLTCLWWHLFILDSE